MPIVAIVDGVRIILYFNDHDPPHFHAELGEFRAKVSIATLSVIDGDLPPAKQRRILEWARDHQHELSAAWADVSNNRKPRRIE